MSRLIFVLLNVFFAFAVNAAEVNNLYQSQLPVSSRTVDERESLYPQLLQQVLLKLVGDRAALQQLDIDALSADAKQYVQQYRYQLINTLNQDLTQPDQLALEVDFNRDSVNQLIQQAGLPLWGKTRPDIVVWMAYQNQSEATLVGLENAPASVVETLTSTANNRGIALLMPLMDLRDQTQLTFHDVWSGNFDSVQAASVRYAPDVVLSARVNTVSNVTNIRWQANINGQAVRWSSQGSLNQAINEGVNELTDRLARNYSQVFADNSAQVFDVSVSNVVGYSDYTRVLNYLNSLDTITEVQVVSVNVEQLDLAISYTGERSILQRTLAIGQTLIDEHMTNELGKALFRLRQ